MQTITGRPGQNLLDIALQTGGQLEAVAELMILNNVGLMDSVTGRELKLGEPINKKLVALLQRKNIDLATGAN